MKRNRRQPITQAHLKDLLVYDPVTGVFTWSVSRGGVRAGSQAGAIWTNPRSGNSYVRISVYKNILYAHRLAWLYMTGEWPKLGVDHKDLNGLNNAWSNLREANKSQNAVNTEYKRTNKSGFKGVSFEVGRYRAQIKVNGKRHHLGRFDTPEDAHAAYLAAAIKYHGEYARLPSNWQEQAA